MTLNLYFILVPTAELFSIAIYYIVGGVQGLAGYVDFCYADQISKLELLTMAKELRLNVEGCSIWWLDSIGENKGLKEIQSDIDVLAMALTLNSHNKEMYVEIRIADDKSYHVVYLVASEDLHGCSGMVQSHDNTDENAQRDVEEENDCQEEEEEMNDVDSDLESRINGSDSKGKENEGEVIYVILVQV